MNKALISLILIISIAFSQYEYSKEDLNTTSSSYGEMVWNPTYNDYITLHYFTTQGWAGWTSIFGQLSDFQEELHAEGYEKVVIIGIGQSAQQNFNSNFCTNQSNKIYYGKESFKIFKKPTKNIFLLIIQSKLELF